MTFEEFEVEILSRIDNTQELITAKACEGDIISAVEDIRKVVQKARAEQGPAPVAKTETLSSILGDAIESKDIDMPQANTEEPAKPAAEPE